MPYNPVTHVIFDLDGTILDTEPIYSQVLLEIGKKYGQDYTKELRLQVTGRNEKDTAKLLINAWKLHLTTEEFVHEYEGKCRQVLKNTAILPGVEKLVRHLHAHKIPIAIATSSSDEGVALKTAHLKEFFSLFHHKVMGSSDPEVIRGKPFPDIFLVCASRFDDAPSPDKCLVFEDALNGALGGISAGMQVVHIPDSFLDKSLCTDATLVLDSMEMFVPEEFGLPPY